MLGIPPVTSRPVPVLQEPVEERELQRQDATITRAIHTKRTETRFVAPEREAPPSRQSRRGRPLVLMTLIVIGIVAAATVYFVDYGTPKPQTAVHQKPTPAQTGAARHAASVAPRPSSAPAQPDASGQGQAAENLETARQRAEQAVRDAAEQRFEQSLREQQEARLRSEGSAQPGPPPADETTSNLPSGSASEEPETSAGPAAEPPVDTGGSVAPVAPASAGAPPLASASAEQPVTDPAAAQAVMPADEGAAGASANMAPSATPSNAVRQNVQTAPSVDNQSEPAEPTATLGEQSIPAEPSGATTTQ
jgi:hypothetical protein